MGRPIREDDFNDLLDDLRRRIKRLEDSLAEGRVDFRTATFAAPGQNDFSEPGAWRVEVYYESTDQPIGSGELHVGLNTSDGISKRPVWLQMNTNWSDGTVLFEVSGFNTAAGLATVRTTYIGGSLVVEYRRLRTPA